MRYWLIYTHKNRLESPQAAGFDDYEKMKKWYEERKEDIKVIDVAESLEDEED